MKLQLFELLDIWTPGVDEGMYLRLSDRLLQYTERRMKVQDGALPVDTSSTVIQLEGPKVAYVGLSFRMLPVGPERSMVMMKWDRVHMKLEVLWVPNGAL